MMARSRLISYAFADYRERLVKHQEELARRFEPKGLFENTYTNKAKHYLGVPDYCKVHEPRRIEDIKLVILLQDPQAFDACKNNRVSLENGDNTAKNLRLHLMERVDKEARSKVFLWNIFPFFSPFFYRRAKLEEEHYRLDRIKEARRFAVNHSHLYLAEFMDAMRFNDKRFLVLSKTVYREGKLGDLMDTRVHHVGYHPSYPSFKAENNLTAYNEFLLEAMGR